MADNTNQQPTAEQIARDYDHASDTNNFSQVIKEVHNLMLSNPTEYKQVLDHANKLIDSQYSLHHVEIVGEEKGNLVVHRNSDYLNIDKEGQSVRQENAQSWQQHHPNGLDSAAQDVQKRDSSGDVNHQKNTKLEGGTKGDEVGWEEWQKRLNTAFFKKFDELTKGQFPPGLKGEIDYVINPNGAGTVEVISSSGNNRFDNLALKAFHDVLQYHPELTTFPRGADTTRPKERTATYSSSTSSSSYSTGEVGREFR